MSIIKLCFLFVVLFLGGSNLSFGATSEEPILNPPFSYVRNLPRSPADAIQRLQAEELCVIDDGAEFFPLMVSLKSYLPKFVYDQGQLGSCSSNAVMRMIDTRSKIIGAPVINPSRLFNFHEAKVLAGTLFTSSGVSIYHALEVARTKGFCQETTWTYDDGPVKFTLDPSPESYEEASRHRIIDRIGIAWVGSETAKIKSALINFMPVVFGIETYTSFDEARYTGYVPVPKPSATDHAEGGHAMLLVGYDDRIKNSDGSYGAYIAQNSWSETWGDHGFAYIPYKIIELYSGGDAWAVRYISGAPEAAEEFKNIFFRPTDHQIPQPA